MRFPFLATALGLLGLAATLSCGDSTGPRSVSPITASRESLTLEVGETLELRVAANSAEKPVLTEALWSTSNPSVVTVDALGSVTAVGPGSALIIANAPQGADTVRVVVLERIAETRLALDVDTITSLPGEIEVPITTRTATGGSRAGSFTVSLLDFWPTVTAYIAPGENTLVVAGIRTGEQRVVVRERGGSADTILVVVEQRVARIVIGPDTVRGVSLRSWTPQVEAFDSRGERAPVPRLLWTTADATVAVVDSTNTVRFGRVGSTTLRVEADGGARDSVRVIVGALPKLFMPSRLIAAAARLRSEWVNIDIGADAARGPLTFSVVDTSIAVVDEQQGVSWGGNFRIGGRRPGRTGLIVSAPGANPDTVSLDVGRSWVSVTSALGTREGLELIALASDTVVVVGVDSLRRPLVQSVGVALTLTSSDTSIVKWSDDVGAVTLDQGLWGGRRLRIAAGAAGRAVLRASAPGMETDSLVVTVSARPKLRFVDGRVQTLAKGGSTRWVPRRVGTNVPVAGRGTVPITLTNRRPAISSFSMVSAIYGTSAFATYEQTGLQFGTDTLIVSAAGYDPDTAIIVVTRPTFITDFAPGLQPVGAFGWVQMADSLGNRHSPNSDIPISVQSTNTAVANPPAFVITPLNGGRIGPIISDAGTATLTFSDVAGQFVPRSITVSAELNRSLGLHIAGGSGLAAATGARQRFPEEFRVSRGSNGSWDLVLRLRSSDPSVVVVPETINMIGQSTGQSFQATGGDKPGMATITVSAKGYADYTSPPIEVGKPRFHLVGPALAYVGAKHTVRVQARDHYDRPREPVETVPGVISALDAGVTVGPVSTVTLLPGEEGSSPADVTFTRSGTQRVVAGDPRTGTFAYSSDTLAVEVVLPWVRLVPYTGNGPDGANAPILVGVGQMTRVALARPYDLVGSPVTVSVMRRGAHSASPASAAIPANGIGVSYDITGKTIGVDTLMTSAPGYAGERAFVHVVEGRLVPVGPYYGSTELTVGGSQLLRFALADSSGTVHPAAVPITFQVRTTGGVRAEGDSGAVVTSFTISPGQTESAPFSLVGVSPGPGTIEITNLYYRTYRRAVTVRAP